MHLLHRSSAFSVGSSPRLLMSKSESIKKSGDSKGGGGGAKHGSKRARLHAALQGLGLAGRRRHGPAVTTRPGAQVGAPCSAAAAAPTTARAAAAGSDKKPTSGAAPQLLLLLLLVVALACVVALGRAPAVCCCTCAAFLCCGGQVVRAQAGTSITVLAAS